MIKINRREFLKGSAAIGVAGALSGTLLNTLKPATAHASESTASWTPSMCLGCTTWCSVEVKTQMDSGIKRAVDVRGNQKALTHGGYVCPRGRMALQEVYDADRIKTPMERTTAKGSSNPGFVPITWDQAIAKIAAKINTYKNTGQITLMRGRYTGVNDILFDSMGKIIGAGGGYISHSAICAEAENFSRQQVSGLWGYPDYDVDNAKYIILWGVDPTASNRMVAGAIATLGDRMKNGGLQVTAVDVRLNSIGAKAQRFVGIKPGTDGALALAIANWILNQKMWNETFTGLTYANTNFPAGGTATTTDTEKGTNGLITWWNNVVKAMKPEDAEPITGVNATTIKKIACEFAGYNYNSDGTKGTQVRTGDDQCKAISWIGPGVTMAPRGAYIGMCIDALNGLVGSMDHQGGLLPIWSSVDVSPTPSVSSYQGTTAKQGYYKQRIDKYTVGTTTLGGSDLNDAAITLVTATAIASAAGTIKFVKGGKIKAGSVLKKGSNVIGYKDRVALATQGYAITFGASGNYDGDLNMNNAFTLTADLSPDKDLKVKSTSSLAVGSILSVGSNVEKVADRNTIGGTYYGGLELANPQIGSGGAVGGTKSTNRVGKAINDASPYKCELLITNFANFNFSCGGADIWDSALSGTNAPYYVFIGTNVAEAAMHADIVLPAKHHLFEIKSMTGQKAKRSNVVGLMNECITPLWDSKDPETEIAWLLADALNTTHSFASLKDYYKKNFKIAQTTDHANEAEFANAVQQYYAVGIYAKLSTTGAVSADFQLAGKVVATTGSVLAAGTFLRKGTKGAAAGAGYTGGFYVNAKNVATTVAKDDFMIATNKTLTGTVTLAADSGLKSGSVIASGSVVYAGDDRGKITGTYTDDNKWAAITASTYVGGIGNGIRQATVVVDGSSGDDFNTLGRGRAWVKAALGLSTEKNLGTKSKRMDLVLNYTVTVSGGTNTSKSNLYDALEKHKAATGASLGAVMSACNYPAAAASSGALAYMPHYEAPSIAGTGEFKHTLIDHKSRLNREGRSQNAPWYYEFKSCDPGDEKWKDVVKLHPADAAQIKNTLGVVVGVKDGDNVSITSPAVVDGGTGQSITCKVKIWNGVAQGTVAKCYGQGHTAYGRYAAKTFGSVANGGNNNKVIPAKYEQLSGASVRNACVKVKIVKI